MPQDRAPIPIKTIKLLFAQSGNCCAFPGCTEKLTYNNDTVLAEICHIQGYSPDSARYNPAMTDKERNSLQNLVLMCAKHHTIIDSHPEEFPKDKLWEIKKQHEAAITAQRTSTGLIIPHQIPPSPADFTGRDTELTTLLQAHKDGACISGFKGIGGIGKSALAFALTEKLTPHYPDGQLMLDMLGTSQTPLSSTDAMRQVIHTLLPEERLPENETELKNLYLTLLHGKKIILLLDNAGSRAQVEPLIPPKTCFLLVTSRYHFTLPGLKSLDLEALSPASAINLLLSIEPRLASPSPLVGADGIRPTSEGIRPEPGKNPSSASTLASLCEYLPLALRLSASALAEKPATSVAKFLAQFHDTRSRLKLTGMDASLQVSYDLLSPVLQEKLRFLSVFPAPFDSPAAMAIWDLDEDTAETHLNSLVNASLLNYAETTGLSLHDLVRDFASNLLTPAESYTASYRHAAHYLEVARQSDEIFLKGGENQLAGLQLFDAYWPHIRHGQVWSAVQPSSDLEASRLCCDYPDSAANCLGLRLHPEQQIAWLQSGLAAARRLGNKKYLGFHLGNLGNAYYLLGQVDKAIEHYQQVLLIDREIGDRRGEGADLGNLGSAYSDLGQVDKAIQHYQQALFITREIGDRRGEGTVLGNLGSAYLNLGQVDKAIQHYQQALAIAREIGDRYGEGNHLGNLGNAYYLLGQLEKAIEHHQQALAIAREIGDRHGEGNALGNLGNAYSDLGQLEKAIEHHQQALAIAREIGDRRGEGTDLGNLGNAYYKLGQLEKAIEHYQQALLIDREIGDRRGEGTDLGNLGIAYRNLGQLEKAIEHHQQSLAIAREIGDRRNEGAHLGNLGNAYLNLGQVDKAIQHHQQALAIAREIGDRYGEGNHLGNLGNAYSDLGQVDKAIEHYQQSLAIAREIGDRRGEGSRLGNLGIAYRNLGQYEKAIDHYQQALLIAREIGDRRAEGSHLGNLGVLYFHLGQLDKAIEYYKQALAIARQMGYRLSEAIRLGNLAEAYENKGGFVKAVQLTSVAQTIDTELKTPHRTEMEQQLSRLRQKMGDAAFTAALSQPPDP